MFNEIALYINNKLNNPELLIFWSDEINRFIAISGSNLDKEKYEELVAKLRFFILSSANITFDTLDTIKFYKTYKYLIEDSPYYVKYMAYILGNHKDE